MLRAGAPAPAAERRSFPYRRCPDARPTAGSSGEALAPETRPASLSRPAGEEVTRPVSGLLRGPSSRLSSSLSPAFGVSMRRAWASQFSRSPLGPARQSHASAHGARSAVAQRHAGPKLVCGGPSVAMFMTRRATRPGYRPLNGPRCTRAEPVSPVRAGRAAGFIVRAPCAGTDGIRNEGEAKQKPPRTGPGSRSPVHFAGRRAPRERETCASRNLAVAGRAHVFHPAHRNGLLESEPRTAVLPSLSRDRAARCRGRSEGGERIDALVRGPLDE